MAKAPTPFPILIDDVPERWQWPVPPFAWRHLPPPANDVAQACRLESPGGSKVQGEMVAFDPVAKTIGFRVTPGASAVGVAFARFCRLTLTDPLRPAPQIAGAPVERVPSAVQERDYRLEPAQGPLPLVGRTAGRVETDHGLYLFSPADEGHALQRVFVPRSAYRRAEFGPSTEEIAASRWIATPEALLDAIERQSRMPVLQLGHSFLALGLVTQVQLDRALAEPAGNKPLGERLVAAGLLTRADLQTAIAHKMGFPMVDLTRFPIDPKALAKLPQRIAVGFRALPLMLDGQRLVVAIDNPSRIARLQAANAIAEATLVPVLAPKAQIVATLARLSQDVWSTNVPQRAGFFVTTI